MYTLEIEAREIDMPEVMGVEVSQEQFDKAAEIFNQIDELKQKQRETLGLLEKLNIRFQISRLIEERYKVLGL